MGAEPGDFGGRGVVEAGRLVGVAADRGEDLLVPLGGGDRRRRWSPSSMPTLSIRPTPASRAAATSSASRPSQRKRWVWESITRWSLETTETPRFGRGVSVGVACLN